MTAKVRITMPTGRELGVHPLAVAIHMALTKMRRAPRTA